MPFASALWHQLRYYFDVNNSYVVNKLKLIMFPFKHTHWYRQRTTESHTRHDVGVSTTWLEPHGIWGFRNRFRASAHGALPQLRASLTSAAAAIPMIFHLFFAWVFRCMACADAGPMACGWQAANPHPSPSNDINAPDLYIPLMSFVTFVLVVGLLKGTKMRYVKHVTDVAPRRRCGVVVTWTAPITAVTWTL